MGPNSTFLIRGSRFEVRDFDYVKSAVDSNPTLPLTPRTSTPNQHPEPAPRTGIFLTVKTFDRIKTGSKRTVENHVVHKATKPKS